MKKILVPLILSMCGLIASPAFAQEPHDLVEQAIAELEAGLDGRKEALRNDPAALYEMIDGILLPKFNRRYSAQLVLGKNWRTADEAQRERFIDGFYSSLLRKYAEGVLEFDQDRVQARLRRIFWAARSFLLNPLSCWRT